MNKQIKTIADLEACLGKTIARGLLNHLNADRTKRGSTKLRRVPYNVSFKTSKPAMYLGDYDTLTLYVVELSTGLIKREHYCGSFDSAINHPEQGQTFDAVPAGYGMFFVTVHGGGGNLSWSLDIVSPDLVKQLEGK